MAAQTEKAQDWQQASEAIALEAAKAARSEMAEHGERDPILKHIVDNPEKFAHSLAKIVEQGGRALAAYLERFQSGEQKHVSAEFTDFAKTLSKVGQYWLGDPARAVEAQSRLWVSFMSLQSAMVKRASGEPWEPVAAPDPRDKRFADPEWTENQFFDFLKQAYLLSAEWAEAMVDEAEEIDEHTRAKAAFYVKQLTNALSPSNFVLTNPELLRETAAESGENLARGMKILADDIERGGGELRMRQTSLDTFEVGENIAVTPGKVIAQNDVRQLIQYEAQTDEVAKAPLLIIPPWINKFYILDLNPEKSLIKWLIEHGRTVFVVSWINPDAAHAQKDFVSYMREGVLESLDVVQKVTGEDKIDVVGYCVGGTLLGMTLAYLKATGDDRINTATFLTTQVDFTYAGDLKVFVDQDQLEDLEKRMETKGYLDGSHMANAFNMLRSNELIWPYVVNNYIRGKEPFPFDLLYWNSDSTRMPYTNHMYYLRNFYMENRLAKGSLEVDGHKLSLADVTVPVCNVAAREDHIAPAKSVFLGNQLFGGEAHFVLGGSGHIAGIVNPPAKGKYQYWTGGPNEGTLEEWIAGAIEHEGSWWPHWLTWLEAHATGDPVPARPVGGGGFAPIEDAPGSYVKVRY